MTGRMFVASGLCALLALGGVASQESGNAFGAAPGLATGQTSGLTSGESAAAERIKASRQLLAVVGDSWNSSRGVLRLYERGDAAEPWRLSAGPIPVLLGVKGMAWGRGLHENPPDAQGDLPAAGAPVKREGDGRSPAGVFELGPAFGYLPAKDLPPMDFEYRRLDETTICVDDPASSHYNAILEKTEAACDWTSAETMRRGDDQYKYGVVARHNDSPALPGGGSCIFIHVRHSEGKATSGCTAMSESDVRTLLTWLDPAKRPLLVQFPKEVEAEVRKQWELPTP